jgi:dipeptidase E
LERTFTGIGTNLLKEPHSSSTSMRRLYFLGGEDIAKRDSRGINKRAFIDAGGTPFVLVFPWTAESADKVDSYRKIMVDYFKDLGASNVDFAEYSESSWEIAQKVDRSDLIYLPGGFTRILVARIRNKRVDDLLRNYEKVIVGRSAGALALCKECILTRNRENPETVIITGIKLVDFNVKVHYNPSRDDELKELSKEGKIYAIPERSALIYDDDALSFIGDVYLFQNGKKTSAG